MGICVGTSLCAVWTPTYNSTQPIRTCVGLGVECEHTTIDNGLELTR